MSQSYFFDSDKTFDEKAGIFVHHHGAGTHPTVNINNYKEYISTELDLVQQIGYKHVAVPFTHVISEDSEFVLTLQYLVGEALNRDLTVMVIAQGTQTKLTEEEIEVNATAYLNNFVKFIKKNTGRGIIYEGINEPNSNNWYGQNNMEGYRKAIEWDNKLKAEIRKYDPTATFVGAVLSPIYGIPFIKSGIINPTEYAMHPYIDGIGDKGGNTPEKKLLNPTYSMSYDGSKFAATEFGIAVEGSGTDPESNWQGLVTPEEGAALTVRQMIIHDALGIPMQYNFILGYLYVFHQYQFFDLDKNMLPVGVEVKKALSELSGYKFNKWIVTEYGTHKSYVAQYVNGSDKKYAFWNSDSSDGKLVIGSWTISATSKVQYTDEPLDEEIDTFILQTPIGISTIDTSKYANNQYFTLEIPNVEGYKHNSTLAFKTDSGITKLKDDVYYQISGSKDLLVSNGGFIPYAGTVPCNQLEQGFTIEITAKDASSSLSLKIDDTELTYSGSVASGDVFLFTGFSYTQNKLSIVSKTNKAYFVLQPDKPNKITCNVPGTVRIIGLQNLYA